MKLIKAAKPEKPKKPLKVKESQKCNCRDGEVKEWGDGPYADSYWVTCARCKGTGTVEAFQVNLENEDVYEHYMKQYNKEMEMYKIVSKIKLTREEIKILKGYSYWKYVTIKEEDETT